MSYQKEIRDHFEKNKEKLFPGIESGKWRNSEGNYPHILPKENKELNLLQSYRKKLEKYIVKNNKCLKLHVYFHHLNSSQAMCLNFFFPLMEEKALDIVLKFIGFKNETINYTNTCFEKKSLVERNYRPTSFDFYIETNSGKKIFFEVKFTEQKFGVAKEADRIDKFNAVYKENLKVINEKYHKPDVFFKHYQIVRNLICIKDKDSYVVFLYPDKNQKIKNQAEFAKSNILITEFQDNLINLTWEDLLNYIQNNVKNQNLEDQFRDFREKYNL